MKSLVLSQFCLVLPQFIVTMGRGSCVAQTRRTRKRATRGAQLEHASLNEETQQNIVGQNEDENGEYQCIPNPDDVSPPAIVVQITSSGKNISAIRGWIKEDMIKEIDNVKYNEYGLREIANKYEIAPTSMHYWLNGLTHTKRKGPLTVLTKQEEEEIVNCYKGMDNMGHGMELIVR